MINCLYTECVSKSNDLNLLLISPFKNMKPTIILILFGLIGGVISDLWLDGPTRMGIRQLKLSELKRLHRYRDKDCRKTCALPLPPYEPFCASNGRTYLSECLMDCDRTGPFGLYESYDGPCKY